MRTCTIQQFETWLLLTKKNRLIWEGFYNSISTIGDIIPDSEIEDTMIHHEDLRRLDTIKKAKAKGI